MGWVILIVLIVAIVLFTARKKPKKKRPNESSRMPEKREETSDLMGKYDQLKKLKQESKIDEAIDLAWTLVKETEEDSKKNSGWGVAPAPYRELAILYRKQKEQESELKILERYFSQVLAPGSSKYSLAERYKKLAKGMDYSIPPKIQKVIEEFL